MAGQNEAALEEAVLAHLTGLGWSTTSGLEETFGPGGTLGRDRESEPILTYRLVEAVERLNPGVPESARSVAIEELYEPRAGLESVRVNHEKWGLLREGARVTVVNDDGDEESFRVRFVDWDDSDVNDWLAVSQLWMNGLPGQELGRKRPDVVGFVNGIPLLFIELKAPQVAVESAYTVNVTDYRAAIPQLFWFNGLMILSNGPETKVGSTYAPWGHFSEWRKVDSEDEEGELSLPVALDAVAARSRLLDIVENYTAFVEERGGLIKAVAKNHQYLGVSNAMDAYDRLQELEGRLGVFWHTTGAGKSLSMLFFTQQVLRKRPGSPTFVMVTDRIELDNQLYGTFQAAGAITGGHVQAETSAHLRQLLSENHRYVFTLIHKFLTEPGTEMPVLSDRDDIVVITDEAHRSQYDQLAANMRQALPNASFLGFTGTPLIAGEERTREVFGEYVSTYNFRDSVADKATVPLFYENRIPELQIANENFSDDLVEVIEEADLDEDQDRKLSHQFSQLRHLITRSERLEEIADDVVEHFCTRGFRGKAMYVAIDKATAVRMYDLVRTRWDVRLAELKTQLEAMAPGGERDRVASRIEFMEDADMAVMISHSTGEVDEFNQRGIDIAPHRHRIVTEDLEGKFKDPDDPFRLVFLCAMWCTGFDVPSCSTIYLDKPMRNHSLMQTISRANRVFAEKHSGLIVDYVGVFRRLEQALAIYGAPSGGSADDLVLPKERLVDALTEAEADLRASLTGYGADLDALIAAEGFDYAKRLADTAELVLAAGEEERRSFVNRTTRFMRIYRAALPSLDAFAFSRVASALRMIVKRVQLATPAADISEVMERINVLLDESIATEGFLIPDLPDEERIVDLSGVDWDALQEAATRRYTAAERIKQLLAERTSRIARTNPTYEELAEKFENLVEAYNNGSVNIEELLRRLRALVGELDEYEQRLVTEGLTEEQLAVFDLLTKPEPELDDEEQARVKGLARELFAHIEETLVLDWRKNQATRAGVRVALTSHLDQLPEAYDRDLFETKCGLVYEYVFSRADQPDS